MFTLLLVVLYTAHEHYADILDLFGFPGYGHYDDPERNIHHVFPAPEAVIPSINVRDDRNNRANNIGTGNPTSSVGPGPDPGSGSGDFSCVCGCGCGCDVTSGDTGAIGAIPAEDASDADSDDVYSRNESGDDDLFIESDSDSGAENDNDNDEIDHNININGIIDYIDDNICYDVTPGALNDQNDGNTNDNTETVYRNSFCDALDYGNNISITGSLAGIFLETEDEDDSVYVDTVNLFRDTYKITGDLYEDKENLEGVGINLSDPFSDIYH